MNTPSTSPRPIELLSPAKDLETAIAAIEHGADAVYIGASSFGARAAAGNSTEDICRLTEYAHRFRVRVYATVNTIVYDSELKEVEKLIHELYRARVDALIVQDMGILRLDLPPIEFHASTQCDTRESEKARFLQDVGFSQIVLARELTLQEISRICSSVDVPVETFIHGALCVSYSGRCHAGEALMHRSANRGRCPQVCRMKFDLVDANRKKIIENKHLLSLSDFNASASLQQLLEAGVSSFKIEGRLKDVSYVKNITAYYRRLIDSLIASAPDKYVRSSCGISSIDFIPDPYKSFNRGFTSYFLASRRPSGSMASIFTPKSLGEPLKSGQLPNNGDGLAFFNPLNDEYEGFRVNKVENGRIIPARQVRIPKNITLYRTYDNIWERKMAGKNTASRKIAVDIQLFSNRVIAEDERGCRAEVYFDAEIQKAKTHFDPTRIFEKTGTTIYVLRSFISHLPNDAYIPPSILTSLRREILETLDEVNTANYPFRYRRPESIRTHYPNDKLDYRNNVANQLAEKFYREHGVKEIEYSLESNRTEIKGKRIMTCRYCILRQIGRCLRDNNGKKPDLPLHLRLSDGRRLPLHFDCKRCEMQVFTE